MDNVKDTKKEKIENMEKSIETSNIISEQDYNKIILEEIKNLLNEISNEDLR